MMRITFKTIFFIIFILLLGIIFLSTFGLETKRFNNIVEENFKKENQDLSIKLDTINVKFLPFELSLNLLIDDPLITYKSKKIQLRSIKSKVSIFAISNKSNGIKTLELKGENQTIKDILEIIRDYKNSLQIIIASKFINSGYLDYSVILNFDKLGNIKKDYLIEGKANNIKINLPEKNINIDELSYLIQDKKYTLSKLKFSYQNIIFNSNNISINRKDNEYDIFGDFDTLKSKVNLSKVLFPIKIFEKVIDQNLILKTKNKFSFKINNKFKMEKLILETNLNVKEIKMKIENKNFKNMFNVKKIMIFEDQKINIKFSGNSLKLDKDYKISLSGKGNINIDNNIDEISYSLNKKNNDIIIKSKAFLKNNTINLDLLKYKKKAGEKSLLDVELLLKKNNNLNFKEITFLEGENKFYLENFIISDKSHLLSIDQLILELKNTNKVVTKLKLSKNKTYNLTGKLLDASKIIDNILEKKNQNKTKFFKDFNEEIIIKLGKLYLDDKNFVVDINGKIKFTDGEISNLNLTSYFPNKEILDMSIRTTKNNEKITTLSTKYPKPLVKRYKFVKGFEEGIFDFQSIKKGNISKSILIIDNFKVKKVPVLAKILTLASLQGIADILTGEGIRFTDFEMKFSNKGNLMTIDEIYAIGPAISILMKGYIQMGEIVSLRGTLVPATTINRTISSIPILGDILVGKKVGEGVFGVSFKVKGPPKNLKTTVNPIKTLTPRFISRTLEKIKKN